MKHEDFTHHLERLQRAATSVQAGLDRGGITATPGEMTTIRGIARGLKRSVITQVAAPAKDRAELVAMRDAVLPLVTERLPGWNVNARYDATGRKVFALTAQVHLGPLSGAALYGASIDELESAARVLEERFVAPVEAAA